ncbi:MAG: type II toxin-antitoxin system prevent-host-death family antitoxin [Sulfuriferula sp.]|jgi:antitoxin YefM
MDALSYSYTRQHFADVMDKVNDDCAPVLVTRQNGKPVVLMSLADFNAMEETAYLLRSPENARRLMDAVAELRRGAGVKRKLLPDAD